jgi:hypothetical protein
MSIASLVVVALTVVLCIWVMVDRHWSRQHVVAALSWLAIASVTWLLALAVGQPTGAYLVVLGASFVVLMVLSYRARALWFRHVLRRPDPWLERKVSDAEVEFVDRFIGATRTVLDAESALLRQRSYTADRTSLELAVVALDALQPPSNAWASLLEEAQAQGASILSAWAAATRLDPATDSALIERWEHIQAHLHALRHDERWPSDIRSESAH